MWYVSLPVWGERYHQVFERYTWPALKAALDNLDQPYLLITHTDNEERMRASIGGGALVWPVPGPNPTSPGLESLSEAHRQVIRTASNGDRVCLFTADLVVSTNALRTASYVFATGKQAVAINGMRANEEPMPRPTMPGRELLAWGWAHRHPMTQHALWPDGLAMIIWRMYFQSGNEVVCRMALPHPLAFVKVSRGEDMFSPTCDVNLLSRFPTDAIYVVTDPDQAAVLELSPPTYWSGPVTISMRERYLNGGSSCPSFSRLGSPFQEYCFNHKVIIRGTGGDVGDEPIVQRLVYGQ